MADDERSDEQLAARLGLAILGADGMLAGPAGPHGGRFGKGQPYGDVLRAVGRGNGSERLA